ncbi:Protein N-acetyltransferase, RimJ/RimL family [Actinokineospora iranica]|uniref:Protein N-acetyltransferase, RimJ/RimL family n=1 Tax=Actinokineospora iranica TaxID=1271860 RepID=A0A1G6SVQ8_9PSEU|nr:Protein N-acetyltransferase, RimJ/RimL family [Actinokineospora iranica]
MEINAGKYYLRALRDDARIDDRPAIIAGFADPESKRWLPHLDVSDLERAGAYIARRRAAWADETRFSWVVADPLTGEFLGEVLLKEVDLEHGTAEAGCWALPAARGKGMTTEALGAVIRFGFGALGLREITYKHYAGNVASRRVAEKLGFSLVRDTDEGALLILRNGTSGTGGG